MINLIRAERLTKVFDTGKVRTVALDCIDLSIAEGESIAIEGPSGSGKSTLLSIVGLLDEPTEGRIWLKEHAVRQLSAQQKRLLRNRQIGWVFQNFNLIGNLDALENVTLPLRYNRNVPYHEYTARGREVLDRVGLTDKVSAFPQELSGGQQQRLAIARALINRPGLLLADEPTGNLDTQTGAMIMDLMLELCAGGTTLLVVTHDRSVSERCSRILNLRDGRLADDQSSVAV